MIDRKEWAESSSSKCELDSVFALAQSGLTWYWGPFMDVDSSSQAVSVVSISWLLASPGHFPLSRASSSKYKCLFWSLLYVFLMPFQSWTPHFLTLKSPSRLLSHNDHALLCGAKKITRIICALQSTWKIGMGRSWTTLLSKYLTLELRWYGEGILLSEFSKSNVPPNLNGHMESKFSFPHRWKELLKSYQNIPRFSELQMPSQ